MEYLPAILPTVSNEVGNAFLSEKCLCHPLVRKGPEMNGFVWSGAAVNDPVMNGPGKACFQWMSSSAVDGPVMNGLGKACILMAGFYGMLLDLIECFVLPVCNSLLKVTFFSVEMVSIVAGVGASLGTLNSVMPNLSDAGYDNSIGGLVASSNT